MTFAFPEPPFVLLDDARGDGAGWGGARLYADPVTIVATRHAHEVAPALDALRTATRGGLHAAGYVTYEAGEALDPTGSAEPGATAAATDGDAPLLWFGLFRGYRTLTAAEVEGALPDAAGAWAGVPEPLIERAAYLARVAAAKALIAAGDIYQANVTFRARVPVAGHPLALYAGLRARSAAGHGAVVAAGAGAGTRWLLSLSPELFFEARGRRLTTRPMKGTAPRDTEPALLATDAKARAENLMIVDLLRNDLSRVAEPGSVAVPALFAVETYPTLHQMTSTVTATLVPGRDAIDALAALFPCGSITGAPKHRARQVIADLERRVRGIYTGSIGRFDPSGDAAFNVAIRTLEFGRCAEDPNRLSLSKPCPSLGDTAEKDTPSTSSGNRKGPGPVTQTYATLGLGAGIVADSVPADEWDECLAKGAFVASARRFDLIETMRFDPLDGIARLDGHLARLAASARAFGFALDRHGVRNELQAATFRLREPARVRLLLARSGAVAIQVGRLPAPPSGPVAVRLAPLPVDRRDFRLRHKTTDRRFYGRSRHDGAGRDAFEIVFVGPDGCVTEGSFTNVFVPRGDELVTPALGSGTGLLGGVFRAELLDMGRAVEGEVRPDDLSGGFFVGNALRGLLPAVVQKSCDAR